MEQSDIYILFTCLNIKFTYPLVIIDKRPNTAGEKDYLSSGKNESDDPAVSERRLKNRIPVKIDARFFRDNMFYSGKILNLSDNGMLIKTNIDIHCGESFIVQISTRKDLPKLVVMVKRITGENSISPGVGVKLINPPQQYTDFVEDLSSYMYI